MKSTFTIGKFYKKRNSVYKNIKNKSGNKSLLNSYEMSTINETSIPMQNEDDGIHETYSHATGSKDNEDYETPYENDQYEQPYKGHIYAEYEKPKNKTEQNKKRKNLLFILFALVIVLFIVGCCILAVVFLLLKVLRIGGLENLLVLVIVLLIAGMAAGIYTVINFRYLYV